MLDENVRTLLNEPRIARISTIDSSGYPHTVPVWFVLEGDEIWFTSHSSTRKVEHVRNNSKGAVTVGGDATDREGGYVPGYLFKGTWEIVPDSDHSFLKRVTHRYETPEQAEKDLAEWIKTECVVMRFKIEKVIRVM